MWQAEPQPEGYDSGTGIRKSSMSMLAVIVKLNNLG